MTRTELKLEAIKLRKKGFSYALIAEKLGLPKSTLSNWLSHIPYTPNAEVVSRIGKARARSGEQKSVSKQASFIQAELHAKSDLGELTKRDIFLLGIGLYIGEGSKTQDIVRVVNSDPAVIRLAILWFKKCFGMTNDNFSIRIHLYPDIDAEKAQKIWEKETGLPPKSFQKIQVDRRLGKKMARRGKLAIGTAHLGVRGLGKKEWGVYLARYIRALMKEALK